MEEKVLFKSPPRLLLGVTFLFWGAMLDQPLAALIAAIAAESRHWTKIRWNFGEKGFARSWQLCMLILIVVAVGFLQSEDRTAEGSLFLLSWLPFILMPMGLAQQYSSDRGVPLTTFSYFARRKLAADRKAGRPAYLKWFQFGYCWFGIILFTAGLGIGKLELERYYFGVCVLMGVALFHLRGSRKRPAAWAMAFMMAVVMAGAMTEGVYVLYKYVVKNASLTSNEGESQRDTETKIGDIADLQLSPKIEWRFFQDEGEQPGLLRLAAYNKPVGSKRWTGRGRSPKFIESKTVTEERDRGGAFLKMFQNDGGDYSYREEDLKSGNFGSLGRVIGLVDDQSLIPSPINARRIQKPKAEGMEYSILGATRVFDPNHGAMELVFEFENGTGAIEDDPSLYDLQLPSDERKGLTRFWKFRGVPLVEWQRDERRSPVISVAHRGSLAEQKELLTLLAAVFASNPFAYDLKLKNDEERTPITYFLENSHEGHCEYYASASVMLLRRVGIPARYVVGYAVEEEGDEEGEWILRGKHAHAWAQAYIGGKWKNEGSEENPVWRCRGGEWVTVDNTPTSWLSEGGSTDGWLQKIKDWGQIARQDIILWFSQPLISVVTKVFFISLFVLLIVFLIYRLVVTRRNSGLVEKGSWENDCRRLNALKDFERWLGKRVGRRPRGTPMAPWLAEHLGEEAGTLIASYQRLIFDPRARETAEDERQLPQMMFEVKRLKRVVRSRS